MTVLLVSLLSALKNFVRRRAALQAETLALRHQLLVLQRSNRHRPRLSSGDRFLWVCLSRVWKNWRSALILVKPETVIAWHRKGFRLDWRWKVAREMAARRYLRRSAISFGPCARSIRCGERRGFTANC